MTERVVLDKVALRKFTDLMDTISAATGKVLDDTSPRLALAGTSGEGAAYRGGVKVTLGSVNFDHPGRAAGEQVADRIAESLNFVISLEEGARALRDFAETVTREMDGQDSIAAEDLRDLEQRVPVESKDERYGVSLFESWGLGDGE